MLVLIVGGVIRQIIEQPAKSLIRLVCSTPFHFMYVIFHPTTPSVHSIYTSPDRAGSRLGGCARRLRLEGISHSRQKKKRTCYAPSCKSLSSRGIRATSPRADVLRSPFGHRAVRVAQTCRASARVRSSHGRRSPRGPRCGLARSALAVWFLH